MPADLAPLIAELSVEELAALFRVGSRELEATIFTCGPLKAQKKLLKMLTQAQAAGLLNALPPDERTAFLNELALDVAMQMRARLTPGRAKGRAGAPRVSRAQRRPNDDAGFCWGTRRVEGARGARFYPGARLRP